MLSEFPNFPTDSEVLDVFGQDGATYDSTSIHFGKSRGWVYNIVKRHNALKNTVRRSLKKKQDLAKVQAMVFKDVLNQVLEADVHDWIDMLPDGCGNLALFSPPYNIGVNYDLGDDSRPFAEYKYDMSLILAKLYRKLASNGAIALQIGNTFTKSGITPLDEVFLPVLRDVGFHIVNRVILGGTMGLHAKRKLSHRHEVLVWAVKNPDDYVFNLGAIRIPQKDPKKRAFKGPKKGQLSGHPLGSNPGDVWSGENLTHKHNNSAEGKAKALHPCPFKDVLARRVIMMASRPGDLVLAPYSGHGTTEAMAKATGRLYAGCDIAYTEVAQAYVDGTAVDDVHSLTGVSDEMQMAIANDAVKQLALGV